MMIANLVNMRSPCAFLLVTMDNLYKINPVQLSNTDLIRSNNILLYYLPKNTNATNKFTKFETPPIPLT